MTVDDFVNACDRILVERAHTLKEWQVADIALYKKIVRRPAFVITSLDEYYLSIVGVPSSGYITKPKPRPQKKAVALHVQEKLF